MPFVGERTLDAIEREDVIDLTLGCSCSALLAKPLRDGRRIASPKRRGPKC